MTTEEPNTQTPKTLRENIDAPILKSVVGLALLGYTPIFSCCGFKYEGEAFRKDHFVNKPYIYLNWSKMADKHKAMLTHICVYSGWKFDTLHNADPNLTQLDFYAEGWKDSHPWNKSGCLHRPEPAVLAIHSLESCIKSLKKDFAEKAVIRDGNAYYKYDLGIKDWQYEPCEDWIVTPEDYEKL